MLELVLFPPARALRRLFPQTLVLYGVGSARTDPFPELCRCVTLYFCSFVPTADSPSEPGVRDSHNSLEAPIPSITVGGWLPRWVLAAFVTLVMIIRFFGQPDRVDQLFG